ncbi:MAG TPA: condensation domain-containing protein, partial [Thermoanaerobaculia bacterium]
FRTRFVASLDAEEPEPLQSILPEVRLETPVIDLSALPEDQRSGELRRQTFDEAATAFDLAAAPLLRTRIVRLAPEDHALLLTVHHIIADGWSMGILHHELAALYDATVLPPAPIQYADFAVWQRRRLSGEILERQVAYWRQRLAGAPPHLSLPTDRPRPPVRSSRGGTVPFLLPQPLAGRLGELARRNGATLHMVLLAAFQTLLARWSGQDEALVGTYSGNRPRRELEGLIGFFVNTLVLRTSLAEDPAFGLFLGRVRETTLGAYAHADIPFEKLLETLVIERDPSRTPLFQALLVLHNFPPIRAELRTGVRLSGLAVASGKVDFDLELWLGEAPHGIAGYLGYSAALFDAATMARFAAQLRTLLEGATAEPGASLSELRLMSAEEERELLQSSRDQSGRTWALPTFPDTVHDLFLQQAGRTPDRIAAVDPQGTLSYGEVAARSSALAGRIQSVLPRPFDRPVALLADADPLVLAGMLGILQAGAGFVPLDPRHPDERLGWMVQDAGCEVLVTQRRHLERAARLGLRHALCLEDEAPSGPLRTESEPGSLAYTVYTSGST